MTLVINGGHTMHESYRAGCGRIASMLNITLQNGFAPDPKSACASA
ncbi:hypothetical protein PY650_32155 [Rhizobium calliandrae]|uniref:Uncharacterized protein n=1 Tax=Rhizobium calliandrae TaxID=1312182 RepID=A0ABT7KNI3_9HYPH|nr:hypothetical protein [Rhizobium calliandrae]MDL2410185.1 hypothetical protein [Rhizobium calliandrae]